MSVSALRIAAALMLGSVVGCGRQPATGSDAAAAASTLVVAAAGHTAPVPTDPDDPAIWRHPTDPAKSLILGTDKMEGTGGLYVFGLDGAVRHAVTPLDRPNNVDVEYGVDLGAAGVVDIAVVTERKQHRLRLFAVDGERAALTDLAPQGLPVLEGQTGDAREPMGVAVYKRPRDGTVFAIVAPKTGADRDYVWQYRLAGGATGPSLTLVRRFGAFDRTPRNGEVGEIEAVVVDDALGYVYFSDEWTAIRKYHADPDHPDAARELATLGTAGYQGDREGLAIYDAGAGTGYLVSSDQVPGGTHVKLYRREGTATDPHDHPLVATVATASDETDGLEVSAAPLPGFLNGLLVMMNSGARNFLIYDWNAIVRAAAVPPPR